ncbi:MAG: DNA repair protein RecO [Rickettsiales bacterium]|nr:DNA repair protein RecO [Rickettsiales bacterium]
MELEGTAIILEAQEYLNDLLIMSVLFEQHGIRKGAIKRSKTNKTALTVGNILHLRWYARLENHLGNFNIKSFETIAPFVYHDKKKLLSLLSICNLYKTCLMEKEPQENLFFQLENFLYALKFNHLLWLNMFVIIELELLSKSGFGLDLRKCVVTGSIENLTYISPRTGKAVAKQPGEQYKDKLFILPKLFIDPDEHSTEKEVGHALQITRYFLEKNIFADRKENFPTIRKELEDILKK